MNPCLKHSMSYGACSSEEIWKCEFVQVSEQTNVEAKAECFSVSLPMPCAIYSWFYWMCSGTEKKKRIYIYKKITLHSILSHSLRCLLLSLILSLVVTLSRSTQDPQASYLESLNIIFSSSFFSLSSRASWLSFTPMYVPGWFLHSNET